MIRLMALTGLGTCLALAFNTTVLCTIAIFNQHKITLEFNQYHEHIFEVILCIGCFGWGIWGLFYFINH
jgi:hypothetical protein